MNECEIRVCLLLILVTPTLLGDIMEGPKRFSHFWAYLGEIKSGLGPEAPDSPNSPTIGYAAGYL